MAWECEFGVPGGFLGAMAAAIEGKRAIAVASRYDEQSLYMTNALKVLNPDALHAQHPTTESRRLIYADLFPSIVHISDVHANCGSSSESKIITA